MITLENLGTVNKNRVDIGNLSLWFSYKTIVAFQDSYYGLKVRENDWSTTTGKLLNELQPNKSERIPSEKFELLLDEVLKKYNLV